MLLPKFGLSSHTHSVCLCSMRVHVLCYHRKELVRWWSYICNNLTIFYPTRDAQVNDEHVHVSDGHISMEILSICSRVMEFRESYRNDIVLAIVKAGLTVDITLTDYAVHPWELTSLSSAHPTHWSHQQFVMVQKGFLSRVTTHKALAQQANMVIHVVYVQAISVHTRFEASVCAHVRKLWWSSHKQPFDRRQRLTSCSWSVTDMDMLSASDVSDLRHVRGQWRT